MLLAVSVIGPAFAGPPVNYAATVPGPAGVGIAFAAELAISALLMLTVLTASNEPRLEKLTGIFAGLLVATYITFEAPLSGMSMNPARTLASALPGGLWQALWVYFLAPPLGMLLAVELHRLLCRTPDVACAKLDHHTHRRCIFRCGYAMER